MEANRASSLQLGQKGDSSAREQREVQLLIRDAPKWSKALKGTALNTLSLISTQGSAYLHPLSCMNLLPLHRWMDGPWFLSMTARIGPSLLNMHTPITDPFWQESAQFFGSSRTASAHLREAKHRRPKRKRNSKESWHWSHQDGMSSCFSESHYHSQSDSRHCRLSVPWWLNSLRKQSNDLSLCNCKKCQARTAAAGSLCCSPVPQLGY